jgi:tRNA(Ile)-lysidine synthase
MAFRIPRELRHHPAFSAVAAHWRGRLAVACSGGVDSTALVLVAAVATNMQRIPRPVVVYVDHLTRDTTAEEGRAVASLAAQLGLPCVRIRVELDDDNQRHRGEARLREQRYAALARVVQHLSLDGVATAHTRNDQVETVFMRLLSGAGPLAGAGMRAQHVLETPCGYVRVIRPLLDVPRSDLELLVESAGLATVDDPSNRDPSFRRSGLRSTVIPSLQHLFPGFDSALLRSVNLAAEDAQYIDAVATRQFASIACVDCDTITIDRRQLRELPVPVASRVLRLAVAKLVVGDSREVTRERIGAVLSALDGPSGKVIQMPHGVRVVIERTRVSVTIRTDTTVGEERLG